VVALEHPYCETVWVQLLGQLQHLGAEAPGGGARADVELFREGHLGEVRGLELVDGRRIAVKVRPTDGRTCCVVAVQRHLFQRGFPCPEPLTGARRFGERVVTVEALVLGEGLLGPPHATESAELLAELVALAGDAGDFPELRSPLAWVAWDHEEPGQWPRPDDLDLDLNCPPGPPWLEDAAARVRSRLASDRHQPVIGHCDWEAGNFGWRNGHVAVVYDWDSLGVRTEAAIVGAAGTVFSCRPGGPVAAEIEETATFLGAYRRHCREWDDESTQTAYAAGLWVLLYNARKELAGGGDGYLGHLGKELRQRLRRAGA
jgi:Phosphotransferase enzyme family